MRRGRCLSEEDDIGTAVARKSIQAQATVVELSRLTVPPVGRRPLRNLSPKEPLSGGELQETIMPPSPHDKSASAVHEQRPMEAQYARQGRGGRRIMIILVIGLALTTLGFALVWLSWAKPLSEAPVDNGLLPEAAPYFQEEGTTARSAETPPREAEG